MSDLIDRNEEWRNEIVTKGAAVDAVTEHSKWLWKTWRETISLAGIIEVISNLPSAQPEQPTGVQDILQYLDEYLHPIVSPEHWSVYSELYDMVSMLPSAQPERKTGRWILTGHLWECDKCGCRINRANPLEGNIWNYHYCPNCGVKMEVEHE